MAEPNEPDEQDPDFQMPPISADGEAPRREKKKKGFKVTHGKLFMGALAVMFLFAAYTLLSGEDETITPGTQQSRSGGAEVDTELTEFERRVEDGGGVGQERAEVLAEIDEREALQRRIEDGRSAVSFGEPIEEEEQPETVKTSTVFGDVTPREVPPQQQTSQARAPRVAPISGTVAPQAPNAPGRQAQSGAEFDRIQYELELAQTATTPHVNINYHQSAGGAPGRIDQPHPLTPSLAREGEGSSAGSEVSETLALPGDVAVAYLANRISSDQPSGKVRVDILDGKLRGGRMLGEAAFEGERLIINFDQLVYEGEIFDDVQAVAIDPSTLDASVQDGINRRLFTRYGVPVLAGIASLGIDYRAQRGNPSVTETNLSTGERVTRRTNEAESFGDFAVTEIADSLKTPIEDISQRAVSTKPEVWAQPGAIGLMFITPVERQQPTT